MDDSVSLKEKKENLSRRNQGGRRSGNEQLTLSLFKGNLLDAFRKRVQQC